MKMKRKICPFIILLSLVLPTFPASFAEEKPVALLDISGNVNEQAITVCGYLGIVNGNPDGTYLPDKPVTRAEFAAMLTRALAIPDSALAGHTATSFKDTAGYSWAVPYLAFCQSKGIMRGDGQGNVMPGKTITLNEAITMALRAVGYTDNSALLTGAWPANYISIAQNNDLYKDVSSGLTVDRAAAAQIIYNTLFVQKVSVTTSGETTHLENSSGQSSTMLSTGFKCTMEKAILETTSYPDTLISYGFNFGQYCEIYLNEDEEVIAVKSLSTLLPGYFNPTKTKFVSLDGTTEFEFPNAEFTSPSCIVTLNSDNQVNVNSTAELQGVLSMFAPGVALRANLAVDLSGDKIKQFYSIGIWSPDDTFLAEDDIQSEISEDKTINGHDLPVNDNDEIDYTQFTVFGAASLADITKDDSVYVYENDENKVVYIEVGKIKFSGEVTEYDDNSDYFDIYMINEQPVQAYKNYNADLHVDLDIGSTYAFTLDAWGFIYDADKTSGATDKYGIVKAIEAAGVENFKVKLYTSEDATKTFTFADDTDEIDWTSDSATTIDGIVTGALIGYSLDSNGNIDSVDNTYTTFPAAQVVIQSSKVIKLGASLKAYSIDENCVVMTYDGNMNNPDGVATRNDLDPGAATGTVAVILNGDGEVIALYIENDAARSYDDMIYGVINKRTTTKNSDGETVYKYTGFIDGTAFTYLTVESGDKIDAGQFGVYGFELDSKDAINDITDLTKNSQEYDGTNHGSNKDGYNGWITRSFVIGDTNSDKTVITSTDGKTKFTIDEDTVVYKYDAKDDEFSVSKLSSLRKNYIVSLFDTKGKDADGNASVVIYQED